MLTRFILTGFVLIAVTNSSYSQLTVCLLRHAEGGHNVLAEFQKSGIPKAEWPSYVGNPDAFSPKGESQVSAVTSALLKYDFDFIAVSPTWRTRNTILPYLKLTGKKAEVWPELAETDLFMNKEWTTNAIVDPRLFAGRRKITLSADEKSFFMFRADGSGTRELEVPNPASAMACARRVKEMLAERFPITAGPKRVLLVSHGVSGRTLIRQLLGNSELTEIMNNTHMWVAHEQPDGLFTLELYNRQP